MPRIIQIQGRPIEVDDEQFDRLNTADLLCQYGAIDDVFVLLDSDYERLVIEAHGLLTEPDDTPNPEYDRALVELCSRVMGFTDDDRDLVTLLVGVPTPLKSKEVTVEVTMTVLVENESDAVQVAQRWLPYQRELPLSSSDGATLTAIEVRP